MQVSVESPFPFESLPRVWHWIEGFRHKVADDFSPQTLEEFIAYEAARWKEQRTWAIYADDELGGLVTCERLSPWCGAPHLLLKPDFQGRGYGPVALRRALGEMFASGLGMLEFRVIARNLAMGSLLTSLGATRDGRLRNRTLVGGVPTDVWLYGLTKANFEEHNRELSIRRDDQNN